MIQRKVLSGVLVLARLLAFDKQANPSLGCLGDVWGMFGGCLGLIISKEHLGSGWVSCAFSNYW